MDAKAAAILLATCLVTLTSAVDAQRPKGADYFPNVTLTTQDGVAVRFYDDLVKDKIVAINLIYTTCRYACPLETARLAQVQRLLGDRMGRDVFFYSITIDPEHDTPAVLKEYAKTFHAGPGWLFLNGRRADVDLIAGRLGLATPDPSNPDGHAPNLLVGNEATGQWMRNSGMDNPKFLARTIGDWLDSWRGPRRPLKSYAEAPTMTLTRGEYTFKSHCAACHTLGGGPHIGPDLAGVARTRDRQWLERFIREPDKMLDEHDPIASDLFAQYKNVRMPNLALTHADVDAVIAYLDSYVPAAAAPATAAPTNTVAIPAPLLDAYLHVHDALTRDRMDGVHDAAGTIARAATSLGPSGAATASAASGLLQSQELSAAREAFARLSEALITLRGSSDSAEGDGVSVAYCPMTRHSWLQRGTAIRNPYYGQKMLDCGRFNGASSNTR